MRHRGILLHTGLDQAELCRVVAAGGEGPGVRAGRGEGRAAAERVHHAGRNLVAIGR